MHHHLQQALEAIDSAVAPLGVETIGRPADGRWSIAEILEHLTLAYTYTANTIEKALVSGEARGGSPRPAQWLGRVLVINGGYFPRVQAPERSRPTGSIPPDRSVAAIRDALTRLDATLTQASLRFGDAALVANHPYFAGLTVPQWRKFHWRHTVHHMRQVRARAGRR